MQALMDFCPFLKRFLGLKLIGAKVPFLASTVGYSPSKLSTWASLVGREVGHLSSSYLGLSLGGNLQSQAFFNLVLDKVKKWSSSWRKDFFKGGRLTLI